jgi:uncharacterized membrane protein (DUF2068 family)
VLTVICHAVWEHASVGFFVDMRGKLVNPSPARVPLGFRIIGVYKLVTAGLSLALGFGFFELFQGNVRATLELVVRSIRLDPENVFVHSLITRLAGLDRKQLLWIESGTVTYAILHLIEGIGILRGKRWGGALIILATSCLIPVECFEIVRRRSFVRIAALILNTGIVCYLIMNRGSLRGGGGSTREQPDQRDPGEMTR